MNKHIQPSEVFLHPSNYSIHLSQATIASFNTPTPRILQITHKLRARFLQFQGQVDQGREYTTVHSTELMRKGWKLLSKTFFLDSVSEVPVGLDSDHLSKGGSWGMTAHEGAHAFILNVDEQDGEKGKEERGAQDKDGEQNEKEKQDDEHTEDAAKLSAFKFRHPCTTYNLQPWVNSHRADNTDILVYDVMGFFALDLAPPAMLILSDSKLGMLYWGKDRAWARLEYAGNDN
ncbi:hypothetical protein AC578_3238 [Pseudocercospora eumusae]|uniref:Uncharacterized protein n=1 Tax=Pseudocercospora eumusae TaxID=321146 RepID=A0A139H262_9PEZI|nr:hypothetical protein AC578_3238 [Pseudocercospora eumusae]